MVCARRSGQPDFATGCRRWLSLTIKSRLIDAFRQVCLHEGYSNALVFCFLAGQRIHSTASEPRYRLIAPFSGRLPSTPADHLSSFVKVFQPHTQLSSLNHWEQCLCLSNWRQTLHPDIPCLSEGSRVGLASENNSGRHEGSGVAGVICVRRLGCTGFCGKLDRW